MKTTYAAPTAITTGSIVRNTLGSKILDEAEVDNFKPSGGSNLSFGL